MGRFSCRRDWFVCVYIGRVGRNGCKKGRRGKESAYEKGKARIKKKNLKSGLGRK